MKDIDQYCKKVETERKIFLDKWNSAKSHWKDSVCRQFEKIHIIPLATQIRQIHKQMIQLSQVISDVKKNIKL